ncbi:MAG: penicillin-binding protein activator LpoB [Deltaproteobacteria bacterium]|nr:penicillin-binding protein activator LpoB [Deltaproteobacteria bacterium]
MKAKKDFSTLGGMTTRKARARMVPLLALLLLAGITGIVSPSGAFAQGAISPGDSRHRVAVLEFEGIGTNPAEVASATDQLRDDLVKQNVFTVLDRSQTEAVIGEMAFQQGGMTDSTQAAEMGRMLNVEYIITGRMTRPAENAYQLNVQMIQVQSARISASETLRNRGDVLSFLDRIGELAVLLSKSLGVPPAQASPEARQEPPPEPEPVSPAEPPGPYTAAPLAGIYGNPLRAEKGAFSAGLTVGGYSRTMGIKVVATYPNGDIFEGEEYPLQLNFTRSTLYFAWPVINRHLLRFGVGGISMVPDESLDPENETASGGEFSFEYRVGLGRMDPAREQGLVAGLRVGAMDQGEFSASLVELYVGGAFTHALRENLALYGVGMINAVSANYTPTGETYTPWSFMPPDTPPADYQTLSYEVLPKSVAGLAFGISWQAGEIYSLGVEAHGGHHRGGSINLAMKL